MPSIKSNFCIHECIDIAIDHHVMSVCITDIELHSAFVILNFNVFFLLQWVIHLYESIHVLPKFIYLSTCNMYHSQKYWNSTYIFGIENYSHFSLQLWFHVMWHIAGYWPAIYPMTIWVDGYMKGFIGDKVVSWKSYFMFIFRLVGARKTSLIARFIGSTWGPLGVARTQVGPM